MFPIIEVDSEGVAVAKDQEVDEEEDGRIGVEEGVVQALEASENGTTRMVGAEDC